jgi:hypothetical protein
MKILGDNIFAKDASGNPLSRIATIFLRTPGLVTRKGVHAMQRAMWIEEINAGRAADGKPPMTQEEEDAEISESVDLIVTANAVLIRPDPNRMDLAMRADAELQKLVSKRVIRYLNTSSAKVRKALTERGENWRMARHPISQEDMVNRILSSKVHICECPIYYYNRSTGTRFITASGYDEIENLPADAFRRQINEVVAGLNKRNRHGFPEVDVFPLSTPPEVRQALKALKPDALDDAALKAECTRIDTVWRMSLPAELRDETVDNFDWRNAMSHTITRRPNETAAEEQELIEGISPEFYRQIEWLPGARIIDGEVMFDAIYSEAQRTQDPELLSLCDNRLKSLLFNSIRLLGDIDYINIGRIARSLARRPVEGSRRGNVYVVQYREKGRRSPEVLLIRLQKWGVAERLDEGKSLVQAIIETDEYSDYILDRRLMCRQLGMNLPARLSLGRFTEKYRGNNEYNGVSVRNVYYARSYVTGTASDKVSAAKLRNPAWARRFAELMGEAAAVDLVVGRRSSVTGELMFDDNYEIVQTGDDGFPCEVKVTDHAGSFVDYDGELEDKASAYAQFALRRRKEVSNYDAFVKAYLAGFTRRLDQLQSAYRGRRTAFDGLFADRPYDTNGSGAYRWSQVLARLDRCDPERVTIRLESAARC